MAQYNLAKDAHIKVLEARLAQLEFAVQENNMFGYGLPEFEGASAGNDAARKVDTKDTVITILEKELQQKKHELEFANRSCRAKDRTITELSSRLASSERAKSAAFNTLSRTKSLMSEKEEAYESELEGLSRKVHAKEAAIHVRQSNLAAAELASSKKISHTEAELRKKDDVITALRTQISASQRTKASNASKVIELEAKLKERDDTIELEIQHKLCAKDAVITILQNQLTEAKAAVAAVSTDPAMLEAMAESGAECAEALAELSAEREDVQSRWAQEFKRIMDRVAKLKQGKHICTISNEPILPGDRVVRLPCSHMFHEKYIVPLIQSGKFKKCPIDQAEVAQDASKLTLLTLGLDDGI